MTRVDNLYCFVQSPKSSYRSVFTSIRCPSLVLSWTFYRIIKLFYLPLKMASTSNKIRRVSEVFFRKVVLVRFIESKTHLYGVLGITYSLEEYNLKRHFDTSHTKKSEWIYQCLKAATNVLCPSQKELFLKLICQLLLLPGEPKSYRRRRCFEVRIKPCCVDVHWMSRGKTEITSFIETTSSI